MAIFPVVPITLVKWNILIWCFKTWICWWHAIFLPSLSQIGDLSIITSCLVLPGCIMDRHLSLCTCHGGSSDGPSKSFWTIKRMVQGGIDRKCTAWQSIQAGCHKNTNSLPIQANQHLWPMLTRNSFWKNWQNWPNACVSFHLWWWEQQEEKMKRRKKGTWWQDPWSNGWSKWWKEVPQHPNHNPPQLSRSQSKTSTTKGKNSTSSSSIPRPTTSKGKSSVVQKPATRKYRERLDKLHNNLEDLNKKGKRELKRLKLLPGWEDFVKGKTWRQRLDYDNED